MAGEKAHRFQGAGVFFAQGFEAGDGQRGFLAAGFLGFGEQGGPPGVFLGMSSLNLTVLNAEGIIQPATTKKER